MLWNALQQMKRKRQLSVLAEELVEKANRASVLSDKLYAQTDTNITYFFGGCERERKGPHICVTCLKWWTEDRNRFQRDCVYAAVVAQSLCRVRLSVTPWTAARQASLSITNSQSLLRLTPTESVMPSNHLVLYHSFPSPPIFNLSQHQGPFQ